AMSAFSALVSASCTDANLAAAASISRLSDESMVVPGRGGPVIGDTQAEDQFVPVVVIKHRLHIRISELCPKRVVGYPSRRPKRLHGRKKTGRRCGLHDVQRSV